MPAQHLNSFKDPRVGVDVQRAEKKWTPELAEQAATLFEEASSKHVVVIGDAPGKITPESTTIAQKAHYAIILCREDCANEINQWKQFFGKLNLPVICTAISKMTGVGKIEEIDNAITATFVGLDRKVKADPIITTLAQLIKETLSL